MLQILLCFAGFIMTAVALAGFGSVIKTTDEMIGMLRAQEPLPPDVYFFDSQGRLHPNINDLQKYRRILQTGTVWHLITSSPVSQPVCWVLDQPIHTACPQHHATFANTCCETRPAMLHTLDMGCSNNASISTTYAVSQRSTALLL